MDISFKFLVTIAFLANHMLAIAQIPTDKAIGFTDFGPVAFDSFWRLPEESFSENIGIRYSLRKSSDNFQNNYLTQYFRMDFPLGCKHVLTFRFPYHNFMVTPEYADTYGMNQPKGGEFGDIDILFNIAFLQKYLDKFFNDKLKLRLTGEMHTAPTSRENRQFTDVIKLLGTINGTYSFIENNKHSLSALLGLGGGGWDDLVSPYQNHVFKLGGKISYKMALKNKFLLGAFLGQTYLYGEKEDDEGFFGETGLFLMLQNEIQFNLSLGLIKYTEQNMGFVKQGQFSIFLPIKTQKQGIRP